MKGLWVALIAVLSVTTAAAAQRIDADLSQRMVAVTSGFDGADLLLFGATSGDGDVVVLIEGPKLPMTLYRKERRGGIWVNVEASRFDDMPNYYALLSTRPVEVILDPWSARTHDIGLANLASGAEDAARATDRAALIEVKRAEGLYRDGGHVKFVSGRLFRATVRCPPNMPMGAYMAKVLLVRDGQVVKAESMPLLIEQRGTGAFLHALADRDSYAYAILTIVGALLIGWGASAMVRGKG